MPQHVSILYFDFTEIFISATIAILLKHFSTVTTLLADVTEPCERFLFTCALITCAQEASREENFGSRFFFSFFVTRQTRNEMLLMSLTSCFMPWVNMIHTKKH